MKKKLFNIFACLSIVLMGAVSLVGCGQKPPAEPEHTHTYTTTYTIEGGVAYKVTTCSCNDTTKEEIEDAVIATPETAQVLLNETNNATLVLSAGTYANEALWFNALDTPTNNLKIVGVEGVLVEEIYASSHDGAKITNLYISNIKFYGLGVHGNHTDVEGITVENCEFTGLAGVGFGDRAVKDVVVRNCKFDFNADAAITQTAVYFNKGATNFTVENCTFNNIPYNAIQANDAKVYGNIIIKNNTFTKVGSRVIYINSIENASDVNLVIEGNTFCVPTSPKSDGNYIKLSAEISVSSNNTWVIEDGKADNYYFVGAIVA